MPDYLFIKKQHVNIFCVVSYSDLFVLYVTKPGRTFREEGIFCGPNRFANYVICFAFCCFIYYCSSSINYVKIQVKSSFVADLILQRRSKWPTNSMMMN